MFGAYINVHDNTPLYPHYTHGSALGLGAVLKNVERYWVWHQEENNNGPVSHWTSRLWLKWDFCLREKIRKWYSSRKRKGEGAMVLTIRWEGGWWGYCWKGEVASQ